MAKQLTKNQRTFAIITVSVLLVYAFVNLGLAINSFVKLRNNIAKLEEFATNWQANTIIDLQVTSGACPSGYVNAFTDRAWPGTSSGCYCGASVSSSMKSANNITCSPFCSGTCASKATGIGCKNVNAKAGQTYNFVSQIQVSGSTVSAQVCIKRTDESLFTNGALSASGSCPSGYTKCGSGDYAFCTKQSKCPIGNIEPSSTTYDQSTKASCLAANGCYVISDSGSGYVSSIQIRRTNEVTSLPLSQMTLNEYSMCSTEDEANKTPGRYLFYLLNSRPSGCGTEGAYMWNSAFTTNENILFATNGISISYFSSFPDTSHGLGGGYYPTSETGTSYNYGLYNRDYFPWSAKCRERLPNLVKNIDKVSQTKKAQTALLVVGVLSAAALGIVLSIMELMNLAGKDLPCISGKDEDERNKIHRIKKIISYCFKGVQVPFQIWAIIICATVKGYFADIAKDSCSSADVNATMSYFAKTFQSTYSSNITSIIITIASVLFDIFMNIRKKKDDAKVLNSPVDEKASLKDGTYRKEINDQPPQQSSPLYNGNQTIYVTPQEGQATIVQVSHQQQPQYVPQQQQPQYVPQQQQYPPQQQFAQQQLPPQQFAQQQYPPQQYANQYPPQQYPPQQNPNQYPPQQYPPQQMPNQYPPQQYPNQYPPQQYPPQQNPIAQQEPQKNDYNPTEKFGRGNYY